MNKINISFIIDHLDIGGTETQLLTLIKGMDRDRFNPIVICLKERGKIAQQIQHLGFKVYLASSSSIMLPKIVERLLMVWKIFRLLKRHRTHVAQTYLLTANIFGTVAARLARVPVICSSERSIINTDYKDLPGRNKVFRWVSRWIDVVFGNSRLVADYLQQTVKIPVEKVRYIYNGVALDRFKNGSSYDFRKELSLSPETKLIGKIARLVEQKNHPLLFEAIRILKKDHDNFKVILAGDGPYRGHLEKLAKEMGLEYTVFFLGNRTDMEKILPALDMVVQSSNFEGLPNAIMEAMSASKPVVATDAGGTHELIIHSETGYLVPCNDPVLLARKISVLLDDSELMTQMGEKGFEHIQKFFSEKRLIETTEKMYIELFETKSG